MKGMNPAGVCPRVSENSRSYLFTNTSLRLLRTFAFSRPNRHFSRKKDFIRSAAITLGIYLLFTTTFVQFSSAQTCGTPGKDGSGSISNIVNTYYPSPATATASGTSIPVGAVDNIESGLTSISPGDLILIFQTQNATINTSNTSNYGAGTATGSGTTSNSAGYFEYAVATNSVSTAGGTITISSSLTRTYSSSTTIGATQGKRTYQVIRVPQYLDVTISGTVRAAAWDGKSGGLVILDIAGTLNMGGGTVSAAGKGFRGGLGRSLSGGTGTNTDYATLSTVGNNASKGEGIVGTPRYVWNGTLGVDTAIEGYPGGTNARGAPGNAGGGGTDGEVGGNTENSGGGGGGNGGAGGRGGNSWSSNLAIGGVGGATFPAGVTRLSLGGGGGAGTSNNASETTSSGASGGGAVLIRAGSISGSGTITVDGNAAQDSNPSCCGDGAGGGGAGGSILVTANSTGGLSGIVAYARGGKGGNTLVATDPHGPGGGGGGGVILSNAAVSAGSSVSGGVNGTTSGGNIYGAASGSNGSVNSSVAATSIPGTSPGISCSSSLSITKSSNGPWTIAQSSAQYALTVTNSGSVSTSGTISVKDALPTGISPNWTGTRTVTNGGLTWNCTFSGQDVTCVTSNALSKTTGSNTSQITLPVNVTVSTAAGTNSITNYASVAGANDPFNTGTTPTPNASCTNAAHCTNNQTTVLSPDLTVAKSHSGNFTKGSTGTYTLTVSNSPGTAAASGTITLLDTLPTGLSVNSGAVGSLTLGGANAANWTCNSNSATPQIITCTSSTSIALSGSSILSFSVDVSLSAANSVTNTAAVSGGNESTSKNGNNSATDPTTTIAGPPSVALLKSCISPANCTTAAQMPGTDITYKIQFTNTGGQSAAGLSIVDGVPSNMDYKLGSAASNTGTTGLTIAMEFSSDFDALNPTFATWTYTPISAGGGASAGYDRVVKAIRWRVTSGTLSQTSPNNTGDVSFIAKIR